MVYYSAAMDDPQILSFNGGGGDRGQPWKRNTAETRPSQVHMKDKMDPGNRHVMFKKLPVRKKNGRAEVKEDEVKAFYCP